MSFLERLVRERRADVAAARAWHPFEEVKHAALRAAMGRGAPRFVDALRERRASGRLAVIAEVKRTSPALGRLGEIQDPAALAQRYQEAGAAAISVLVEPRHWGGSIADLRAVIPAVRRQVFHRDDQLPDVTELPVLAKDVIVDEYQIAEIGAAGAHAVLLIAEALDDATLARCVELTLELGMDPLVEAHEPEAFARAVRSGAAAVGVNARDLREPARLDHRRVHDLAAEVFTDQLLVAESGITSVEDARALPPRVDAVLVGTALVRASDPAPLIRALAEVRPARSLA